MKTTIIDADILKHEVKGTNLLRQCFSIFSKTVQKGRKTQKRSFKDVLKKKEN